MIAAISSREGNTGVAVSLPGVNLFVTKGALPELMRRMRNPKGKEMDA